MESFTLICFVLSLAQYFAPSQAGLQQYAWENGEFSNSLRPADPLASNYLNSQYPLTSSDLNSPLFQRSSALDPLRTQSSYINHQATHNSINSYRTSATSPFVQPNLPVQQPWAPIANKIVHNSSPFSSPDVYGNSWSRVRNTAYAQPINQPPIVNIIEDNYSPLPTPTTIPEIKFPGCRVFSPTGELEQDEKIVKSTNFLYGRSVETKTVLKKYKCYNAMGIPYYILEVTVYNEINNGITDDVMIKRYKYYSFDGPDGQWVPMGEDF